MRYFLILTLILVLNSFIFADNGDTIVVQTIDYDTPVNPGWNAPREGKYLFPGDTISYSKILMYYNLKCDPNQNPACGEWDYTTHTKIYEHTGEFDSTQYTHPKFMVNNSAPDTLLAMNSPSFYYLPYLEYSNVTVPQTEAQIGTNTTSLSFPFGTANDGRAQFLYTASELQSAGLDATDITGFVISLDNVVDMKHFTIKMKNYENDSLPLDTLINYGFTKVYEKNTEFVIGENQIDFSFPFNWDGSSNVLLDISYSESAGDALLASYTVSENQTLASAETDNFLHFSGWDLIEVPAEVFNNIDSTITISFWQYGDPFKQPMNNSIFHAMNEDGERVLNVHLPWSNSQIYWDAGQDGGYDRINRTAPNASDFEGQWNQWTFTKNVGSGSMRMYLNGYLFYTGNGKKRSMAGISEFFIGGAKTNNFYEGYIDDFIIWDEEVDLQTIMTTVGKTIDASHQYYNNIRAYYKFDEGSGTLIYDSSPNSFDAINFFGQPQWKTYEGNSRHKFAYRLNNKPFIRLQQGNYDINLLDSIVVVDTFQMAANSIVFYDPNDPVTAIDTILKWPTYYNNYVYDASGNAIDSTLVAADTTLYNETFIYYGDPYEMLIPWEIGRFITPYGNNLSLGPDGFTWIYDVTEYEPFLRDSVHISAGNFQELLDLEFHMIVGTPPRDVIKIEKLYDGYWNLKDMEQNAPAKKIGIDPLAEQWKVKTRTTGHLFDNPTNCAEFCAKTHSFSVDDQEVLSWEILQECAENPLYPQGGTWIYDRAGWCPGMKVTEQNIEITDYVTSDSITIDYNSDYDQYGTYDLKVHLFSYSDFNFDNDATIDEIIAPNNAKRYMRYNPTATNPIIVIKNLGGNNLTSVDIEYGPVGSSKTYNWTGNIEPMKSEVVELEAFEWDEWQNGEGVFTATVYNPNDQEDENHINDSYTCNYDEVDIYPGTMIIVFNTNNAAYQNSYEIRNANGITIFERDNLSSQTEYRDTITLFNGIYDFYMFDSGDNGISFWAEPGQGNGSLKFYDIEGDVIKSFNGDFGDRIYNSFYADMYLDNNYLNDSNLSFTLSPNPSNGKFVFSYILIEESDLDIQIYNAEGKIVFSEELPIQKSGNETIDINGVSSGIYNFVIKYKGNRYSEKIIIR
ncbi:MAG: hypothetical protein C0598_13800 [Marinilabiliales bacterium]|nr:MAG: hypothetical protein C0598_13800 [Marinilabiliales bacterium]